MRGRGPNRACVNVVFPMLHLSACRGLSPITILGAGIRLFLSFRAIRFAFCANIAGNVLLRAGKNL